MAADAPKFKCLLCDRSVAMGGGRWEARYVQAWDLIACDVCYSANHDGIVPGTYSRFQAHLKAKGINPPLNENGWIDWPK
jgi:hypothetical protein